MESLHLKYCKETYDEQGILSSFVPTPTSNFNFAYDCVDFIAQNEPNRRAMQWCNLRGDERTFTFGEMKYYSDKAANVFRSLGIGKGDSVMLVLKRHYQFWFAVLGLHKLGAIAIPGTNLLTKKDFIYRFNFAKVKALVCTADGDVAGYAEEAFPECKSVEIRMIANGEREGWLNFDQMLEEASESFPERVENTATEPMLGYFTSGTTGYPKLVRHNFAYPLAHIVTAKYWQNVDPKGLHLTLAETGWAKAAWGKIYGQWLLGAGIFVCDLDKFAPADLLPLFGRYKITTFCAPPTIFRMFIKEDLSKFDLSSLQHATIAGEALNAEVFNQFKKATGLALMEGFGQTETTLFAFTAKGTEPKPGSMGKPSAQYRVDILDENGERVDNGVVGEICAFVNDEDNNGLFIDYYNDPALTESVRSGGIYHTGDTAWRDEDGYFWYVGRMDDIIKSSGYRIGPFEIESVLMEHPCVLECAVTGAPDPIRGQVVKASVVLAKGFEASEELKIELQEHVKSQTAPYKYPRIIEFLPELPKTISGKIRRVEIRGSDNKDNPSTN